MVNKLWPWPRHLAILPLMAKRLISFLTQKLMVKYMEKNSLYHFVNSWSLGFHHFDVLFHLGGCKKQQGLFRAKKTQVSKVIMQICHDLYPTISPFSMRCLNFSAPWTLHELVRIAASILGETLHPFVSFSQWNPFDKKTQPGWDPGFWGFHLQLSHLWTRHRGRTGMDGKWGITIFFLGETRMVVRGGFFLYFYFLSIWELL